jgi:hypothetical protein
MTDENQVAADDSKTSASTHIESFWAFVRYYY